MAFPQGTYTVTLATHKKLNGTLTVTSSGARYVLDNPPHKDYRVHFEAGFNDDLLSTKFIAFDFDGKKFLKAKQHQNSNNREVFQGDVSGIPGDGGLPDDTWTATAPIGAE
jgi:hypothetical protein